VGKHISQVVKDTLDTEVFTVVRDFQDTYHLHPLLSEVSVRLPDVEPWTIKVSLRRLIEVGKLTTGISTDAPSKGWCWSIVTTGSKA
jgi:hypothetical protein